MDAPGAPGAAPTWGPGRKQGFGTAPGLRSRVWLTVADGNLSEVFYPSLDQPALHGLRFVVSAPGAPPVDDGAEAEHLVEWRAPGLPIFSSRSRHAEYELVQQFVIDPDQDAIVVAGTFRPDLPDLRLHLLACPHYRPGSHGPQAAILQVDPPVLVTQDGDLWIAIVGPFTRAAAGYQGVSDLLSHLQESAGQMTVDHRHAGPGNVAVGAELGIEGGPFQVAIGFAGSMAEAEEVARRALERGVGAITETFEAEWRKDPELARSLARVGGDSGALARCSLSILRSLEDKTERGAFVAAPCAPWGTMHSDGIHVYHRVWPRDLYHIATALIDAGDPSAALRSLHYLRRIQRSDGSWPVNCTVNGEEHWPGVELDEVALPILLAWRLGEAECLDFDPYPTLVKPAAAYLVTNGPATDLDRWEDAGGLSPSTLAAVVCGLLVAGEFADDAGERGAAEHLRAVADYWTDRLEAWCFSPSLRSYVRLGNSIDDSPDSRAAPAMDFLELVRFGVRRPDHPAVAESLAVVDRLLRVDTPYGPAWRRYWGDAYGEHDDGLPWNGSGRGRPWPLLTAVRAQAGLEMGETAVELVQAIERFAAPGHVLPEQVWDGEDLPVHGLYRGRGTGSACPLGWAHAEYLKLLAGIARGTATGAVDPARQRYSDPPPAPAFVWSHAHQIASLATGRILRVQLPRWGRVWWTMDGWGSRDMVETVDTGLGAWIADLPTAGLPQGSILEWTVHYGDAWEGMTYRLTCD